MKKIGLAGIVCMLNCPGIFSQTGNSFKDFTPLQIDADRLKKMFADSLPTKKCEKEKLFFAEKIPGKWNPYSGCHDNKAILLYADGTISEEGTWNGKWIGAYKAYYPNGKVKCELNFDSNGKKTGLQRYYSEEGKLLHENLYLEDKEIIL